MNQKKRLNLFVASQNSTKMLSVAEKVQTVLDNLKDIYLKYKRPWIVGLSGGKDSTCITQLIYQMLKSLKPEERIKPVYILSADALVESPHADNRRKHICSLIKKQVEIDELPIIVKTLRPALNDTFWVNLIGRGYPSPNRWFRWCTDRMKIRPMSNFVYSQIKENGEVIMVLGIRKSESNNRKRTIEKYEISGTKLTQHTEIKGALVYAPISDWDDIEDVRAYLRQTPSPWGDDNNKFLDEYYSHGEADPEFIVDKQSASAGATRMGCWTCTVVPRDWSLEWYIREGNEWLQPLVDYRNWIHEIRDGGKYREVARKNATKRKIYAEILGKDFEQEERHGHEVFGPFRIDVRHDLLKRLLRLTIEHPDLKAGLEKLDYHLITPEEIQAIVQIWLYDGDSIEDINSLFEECGMAAPYISQLAAEKASDDALSEICRRHNIPVELIQKMVIAEYDKSNVSRRYGIHTKLDGLVEGYALSELVEESRRKEE